MLIAWQTYYAGQQPLYYAAQLWTWTSAGAAAGPLVGQLLTMQRPQSLMLMRRPSA